MSAFGRCGGIGGIVKSGSCSSLSAVDEARLRVDEIWYSFECLNSNRKTWRPFQRADSDAIASAISASNEGTVILVNTVDDDAVEIRWGRRATTATVLEPPRTRMLLVNLRTGDAQLVRRRRVCGFVVIRGDGEQVLAAVAETLGRGGIAFGGKVRLCADGRKVEMSDRSILLAGTKLEASVEIGWREEAKTFNDDNRRRRDGTPPKTVVTNNPLSGSRVSYTLGGKGNNRGPHISVSPPPKTTEPIVLVASFNMGDAELLDDEVDTWLSRGRVGRQLAALIIVGVQEASSLSSLESCLDEHLDGYSRLLLGDGGARRIGLGLLIYVRHGFVAAAVSPVRYLNLGAAQGRARALFKGAVGVRLRLSPLDGSPAVDLGICGAHLPAHEGKLHHRVAAMATITSKLGPELFVGCDATMLFGDLNFRLDPLLSHADLRTSAAVYLDGEEQPHEKRRGHLLLEREAAFAAILERIGAQDYASLRHFDELSRFLVELASQQGSSVLPPWSDAPCDFAPTFKVQRGYSDSRYVEKRLPAFTDRVLYAGSLKLESFTSLPTVSTSDHKPIKARFTLQTKQQQQQPPPLPQRSTRPTTNDTEATTPTKIIICPPALPARSRSTRL